MRFILLPFMVLLCAGCGAGDASEVRSAMIAELDTLSGASTVAITGTVVELDGQRSALVHDQSGSVRVEFPERVNVAEGTSLAIQGVLSHTDAGPVVSARTWLYDSTAVPVRSP